MIIFACVKSVLELQLIDQNMIFFILALDEI